VDAQVTFAAPRVIIEPYGLQGEAFAGKLRIPQNALKPGGQVQIDTALNYLYVPVESLDKLGKITFDFANMRQQFADAGIVIFLSVH
jgi:hypothetical protein